MDQSSGIVFDLINKSFEFKQKRVNIVMYNGEPWFCGKEVAAILGYSNVHKALSTHVIGKYKKSLDELYKGVTHFGSHRELTYNQGKVIYVNEPGLYELIFGSNLQVAKEFKYWVFESVLPNIRKIGKDKVMLELEKAKNECEQKYLQEKERLEKSQAQLNRLHAFNQELLTYKRLSTKDETIYIVSTYQYARQGIFKVGRTKTMQNRNSTNNTSHAPGDKVKVLAEFKVNNSVVVEKNIHQKLAGLRPSPGDEHFLCPYDLLYDIISIITDNDASQCEAVNKLIDTVARLRVNEFDERDWMRRLDVSVFDDTLYIGIGKRTVALDSVSDWSDEKKSEAVDAIFNMYQKHKQLTGLEGQTIEWRDIADIIKTTYPKPKMTEWRNIVKEELIRRSERLRIKGLAVGRGN